MEYGNHDFPQNCFPMVRGEASRLLAIGFSRALGALQASNRTTIGYVHRINANGCVWLS